VSEEFALKPIDAAYVPKAVERAEHYRLLNWPAEAESICLDVLAADPDNQKALRTLVLALADQIMESGQAPRVAEAMQYVARLKDEYERTYLEGIVHEREGRAHLGRGTHGSFAYECFRDAMDCYERAEALAPAGNREAALRYNSCVRTIARERLTPLAPDAPEHMLE
jgi:hypothetical protein